MAGKVDSPFDEVKYKTLLEGLEISIKNFSESFDESGRLDAEYYQTFYKYYNNFILDYENGNDTIENICHIKFENYEPENEKEYKYLELSNIDNAGGISSFTKDLGKNLPSRARRKVNTGDVIISSIEGSLHAVALITEEYNNSLCSTGFYVINSQEINSETLLVLFKSKLLQTILKQNCSGTILTSINKDEFLNLKIPLIPLDEQKQIAEQVEKSFALKKESEKLLEMAKEAVEEAIENGEIAAIEKLKKKNE